MHFSLQLGQVAGGVSACRVYPQFEHFHQFFCSAISTLLLESLQRGDDFVDVGNLFDGVDLFKTNHAVFVHDEDGPLADAEHLGEDAILLRDRPVGLRVGQK